MHCNTETKHHPDSDKASATSNIPACLFSSPLPFLDPNWAETYVQRRNHLGFVARLFIIHKPKQKSLFLFYRRKRLSLPYHLMETAFAGKILTLSMIELFMMWRKRSNFQ